MAIFLMTHLYYPHKQNREKSRRHSFSRKLWAIIEETNDSAIGLSGICFNFRSFEKKRRKQADGEK